MDNARILIVDDEFYITWSAMLTIMLIRTDVSPSAFPINDQVRLEVTNTGPGIDEQDLPYIWDRFYKSSHRKVGSTGSGLGLAIVKAVLEAHGAAFGVDSQPGLKTTFWFELKKC